MTTGPPLYLVSACGSAEEFVAAFRRYADRTGLFIPAAAPLPAGRRGRLALTLKDGGVMIEGEAEILQSSARPTVLHGRPGMTVKFVDPDEPSKAVIGELEKARLAMKPAPPSVPPRPAELPPEPRPVVPPTGGRIDAANALAECVVIGDVSTLKETAKSPNEKSGSKFVVPSIPAVGAPRPAPGAPVDTRPKTPTTPPVEARPKTPTAPPDPASTPLPKPGAPPVNTRMTSIGFPVLDKQPAKGESGRVVSNATTLGMPALDKKPDAKPDPALADTKIGTTPAPNRTPPTIPAQNPMLEAELATKPARADATPPRVANTATTLGMAPLAKATAPNVHDEATTIGEGPVPKSTDPMPAVRTVLSEVITDDEATTIGAPPAKKPTDPPMAAVMPDAEKAEANEPIRRTDSSKHKATSIGFPAMRSPFVTQPLGVVPPPTTGPLANGDLPPTDPAPPTLPKSGGRATSGPRGKNPTTPPLTPRHPTPVAPVPIVKMPAKSAPLVAEDEKTDLSGVPAVDAAVPELAAGVESSSTHKAAEQPQPRSGGMRASEILAAIPATGDWTMAPDESTPHVLPSSAAAKPPVVSEPTPAPAPPPKGPPTGDWTISLDPDTGWSEPEKVAKGGAPAAAAPSPAAEQGAKVGNPVMAIASEKPITAQQWEDKPTSAGESKIEIDPTLMGPLDPLPGAIDDAQAMGLAQTLPPGAPIPPVVPQGLGFAPTAMHAPYPGDGQVGAAGSMGFQQRMVSDAGTGFFKDSEQVARLSSSAIVDPTAEAAKKKKLLLMAIGAGAIAVGAIVMLVLTLGGKDKPRQSGQQEVVTPQPATIDAAAAVEPPPPVGSGEVGSGEGSEVAAVQPAAPPDAAVEETPPPPPVATGPCLVQITSTPPGADILLAGKKLGATPGKFELPCGTSTRLVLRKRTFKDTPRAFTPKAGKANKLVVRLARPTFSVKVTSTPAGATITVGGRTVGVTPTTIKLPAYDASRVTLSKPGFAADVSRVTPKQNNASHHVTLKRGGGRR